MAEISIPLFPLTEQSREDKRLKSTEAAYLAGLLDGDGSFSMSMRKRGLYQTYYVFEVHVSIALTDRQLLEDVRRMVPWGNSHVVGNTRPLVGRARPAFYLRWYTAAAERICRAILPYIRLKKPHVELILFLADARIQAERERIAHRVRNNPYPKWFIELQKAAKSRFLILNQRGQDNG